jgi:8-oxo-dGTP pyrophosphatase MutT (NUDIX family)
VTAIDSVEHIRKCLAAFPARRLAESATLSHAAVSLVVRERTLDGETDLLMIRRAEHPNDPWSGHMGFPGGRVDPGDPHPRHTAERETFEELGLSLTTRARFIGPLSELRARSRAEILPLSIFPFVYELVDAEPLRLNHEVAEAIWIPLRFFTEPDSRTTMEDAPDDGTRSLPCYHYSGRTIWGLSLMMLDEFLFEALPQSAAADSL